MAKKGKYLSKTAVEMLENNGYSYKERPELLIFKKPYDFMGPGIFFFLYLLMALPLYSVSIFLGIGVFIALFGLSYLHWKRFSKRSRCSLDLLNKRLHFQDTKTNFAENFTKIKEVVLHSKYNGSYTSSFKKTNEEYVIRVGVQLAEQQPLYFFRFLADYQEPSDEINEVVNLIKNTTSPKNTKP